jgi:sugar phosphate isomerase/epimerase
MSIPPLRSDVARTRTGHFPIGFRRLWMDWHKDLPALLDWSREHHFGVIDLGKDAEQTVPLALKAGLRPGSVDLAEWHGMISPDSAVRQKAVARNIAYIEACGAFGPMNHFVVMLPEKPEASREENFKYMVESYRQLAPALEVHHAKIVIEGWPGPGALCCTPEGYGAFFKECSSPAFGVNYDPSHLLRMGIDPVRFLREFVSRVYHVHGKDTELFPEALYLYGSEQPPTLGKTHGFGGLHWRYTIPGHGIAAWNEIFQILATAGYQGAVSVELEDENFNGTTEGEKAGLLHGRNFLQSC